MFRRYLQFSITREQRCSSKGNLCSLIQQVSVVLSLKRGGQHAVLNKYRSVEVVYCCAVLYSVMRCRALHGSYSTGKNIEFGIFNTNQLHVLVYNTVIWKYSCVFTFNRKKVLCGICAVKVE